MGSCFERNGLAAAAGDECHGNTAGRTVLHKGFGMGHGLGVDQQCPHQRLLYGEQGLRPDGFG